MITDKSGKVVHLEDSQSDETFVCNSLIPGKEDAALVRRLVERLDREAEDLQVINLEINNVNVTITINYHPGTVSQTRKRAQISAVLLLGTHSKVQLIVVLLKCKNFCLKLPNSLRLSNVLLLVPLLNVSLLVI